MKIFLQPSFKFLQLLLLTLFLSACGGGGGPSTNPVVTDDIDNDPAPNEPVIELSTKNITLNVLDIDGSIFTQNVTVNLSGAEIIDANQNPITSITFPTTNSFQARIANDANADLKILAKTNNYVDSGVTLQLNPNTSDYSTTLYLVPNVTGSAKAGIFTKVDSVSAVIDGIAQNEITLSLEESASTPKLSVTIPQGTELSDSNGNPVTPDSSTLVRYDPLEAGVLDAYPGGLNVMADVNGTMEQVNFKSAGFASIVLQNEAGDKVKKFSQDITIAMQFKIGITDNNGKVAVIDDIVPIWSFDEDNGSWSYERDGIVADLDTSDGLYDVIYKTNHLTFYNLDWNIANVCTSNIRVLDENGSPQDRLLDVQFTMPAFNIDDKIFYLGDGNLNLANVPAIATPWMLVFTRPDTGEEVGRYSSDESICNNDHTAVTNFETSDEIIAYNVTAVTTSGGNECDNYFGAISVINGTEINGSVAGLDISGERNAQNGDVLFGLVGGGNSTVASFGGSINGNQGSGTWNQNDNSCSGTWAASLQ